MKTKKGSILDLFYLCVIIVLIGVGLIVVHTVINEAHAALQSEGFTPTQLEPSEQSLTAILDQNVIFLFILIGSGMATVISAFAVRTHPVFFIMFFLVQVLLLAIIPSLTDVYTTAAATPQLNTSAALFNYVDDVLTGLPVIAMVLGLLVAIAMFALP